MCKAGSELLQALFHQHPDIYASATSLIPDYWRAAHRAPASQSSMAMPIGKRRRAFAAGFRGFIDGFYGALTNRPVVMDKNREWPMLVNSMSEVMDQWPIKVVCLVRDLRVNWPGAALALDLLERLERSDAAELARNHRERPAGR